MSFLSSIVQGIGSIAGGAQGAGGEGGGLMDMIMKAIKGIGECCKACCGGGDCASCCGGGCAQGCAGCCV